MFSVRYLMSLKLILPFNNSSMAYAVSHRPFIVEARVRLQVIPHKICDGRCGTVTCLSKSNSVFPVSIILPILHIHPIIYLFIGRTAGGSLGTFKTKQHWIENYFNALFRPGGGIPLFYVCSIINGLQQSVLHHSRV